MYQKLQKDPQNVSFTSHFGHWIYILGSQFNPQIYYLSVNLAHTIKSLSNELYIQDQYDELYFQWL
jgi:hypothetical protein